VYGILNIFYNFWVIIILFGPPNFNRILQSGLAVGLPYVLIYYVNYTLYYFSPPDFWNYLDRILG
jgi:hypothetical protein